VGVRVEAFLVISALMVVFSKYPFFFIIFSRLFYIFLCPFMFIRMQVFSIAVIVIYVGANCQNVLIYNK